MSNMITVTTTADSGAGSLRAAIAAATPGSTIQFASSLAGQTITLTGGQLQIPPGKNLTIDGGSAPGLKISGNNASRIFFVNSNQDFPTTVSFKNLSLINGRTNEQGGAIRGEHRATISVENVSFQNNVADRGGGAIFAPWENNLTVINSQFDRNKATAGNDERGAGAIAFVSPGNFIVRNSSFTNNEGINGGAINSLNGKLTIENSRFINNSTLAASYANGQQNPDLRGYGGALYTDRASGTSEPSGTIRIVGSLFEGNKGKAEGGAAYLYTGTQDNIIIDRTTFKDNEVQPLPQGNGGNGGGVVVMSNGDNRGLAISNSAFVNNTASGQGGGLWTMGAPGSITNSTFSGNKTTGTDFNRVGGAMALYSNTDIVNTTIANNKAGWVGGGISAVDSARVSVKNTLFSNNTADNGTNNWGIQQHTNRQMIDNGGNIQFPPKRTNNWNDYNATATVRLVNPNLGPLQDNGGGILTHALLAGSPAINAGVGAGAPTTDARGFVRSDGQVDIGAFEVGAAAPAGSPPNPLGGGGSGSGSGVEIPAGVQPGSNVFTGTSNADTLVGNASNNVLLGAMGADTLTGNPGADRFIYSGRSQPLAFRQSRVGSLDRITDFSAAQGDRIQLDYDSNLATAQRPRSLFNAGTERGANLAAAARSAFQDKNHKQAGNQALQANEAVFFRWGSRSFVAANDRAAAFSNADLVIDVTGIQMMGQDATLGRLTVGNYFA
ncbi:choice-of-anchor Q domain-containing protein [Leptolyngbya ohadii]|uniref:choice-of-anchor Q domain-containing protein n=1 Tax=Leptolyngbya ohadii TaxID=1962290 RepID=UPI000B599570|nr:choice-of-anchor Q domain-containing protein [Leptolyngbya ohadii]